MFRIFGLRRRMLRQTAVAMLEECIARRFRTEVREVVGCVGLSGRAEENPSGQWGLGVRRARQRPFGQVGTTGAGLSLFL